MREIVVPVPSVQRYTCARQGWEVIGPTKGSQPVRGLNVAATGIQHAAGQLWGTFPNSSQRGL